nr:uroporphyrinogen-III synthase [uncultured Cohaesibacter sp.]
MKILVTRPEIDQQQTISALDKLGFEGISSPVMDIVPLSFILPDTDWQALVVTSRNGLRMLSSDDVGRFQDVPLYCVGERTAELARQLRFSNVAVVAATSAALAEQLIRQLIPQRGPVLYLAGKIRSGSVDRDLKDHGFSVCLQEVYEMRKRARFSQEAFEAIVSHNLHGVLVYSARTCRILLSLLEQYGLRDHLDNVIFYCLSPAVALPLKGLGYPLVVAKSPNERSLLECLDNGHN